VKDANRAQLIRGKGDFVGSRDLEDLVSVIDGRAALVSEIQQESIELRSYVRNEMKKLLAKPQARFSIVMERATKLASV
jgi:DNA helicase HerA-like ATPase